jgi:hypothetical protein
MKLLPTTLLAALLLTSPACIYVRVTGDLDEGFWGGDEGDSAGFNELYSAVDGCLVDPHYDLDLVASPWKTEAEWTVRYTEAGSDGHAAFHRAREAVLARIAREGGAVTRETDEGPDHWTCAFVVDDEPGEASVRRVTEHDDGVHHRLEVAWEERD